MICNQLFHPCQYAEHIMNLQGNLNSCSLFPALVHNQCLDRSNNLPVTVYKKIRYRIPYCSNYTSSENVLSEKKIFSRQFFKEFNLCCSSAQKTRDYVLRILFECMQREPPLYIQEGQTIFQHGIGFTAGDLELEAAHSSYVRNLNIVDVEYARNLRESIFKELTQLKSDRGQAFDELASKISKHFFSPDFSGLKKILRNIKEGKIDSLESALQFLYEKNKNNKGKYVYLLLKCFVQLENYSVSLSESNPVSALLDAFGQKINGRGVDVCKFLESIKRLYNSDEAHAFSEGSSFARDFPMYNEVIDCFSNSSEVISLSNYYHFYEKDFDQCDHCPSIAYLCPKKGVQKRSVVIKQHVDHLDSQLGKQGLRWRSKPHLIFLQRRDVRVLNSIIQRVGIGQSLKCWVDDLIVVSHKSWISHGSELFHAMNRTSALPSIVNQKVDHDTIDQLSTFVINCLNNVNVKIIDPYAASKAVITKMIEKIDYSIQSCQDLISREDIQQHYSILDRLISLYDIEDPNHRKKEAGCLASLVEGRVILESLENSDGVQDCTKVFTERLLDDRFVEKVINIFLNEGEDKKDVLNIWFAMRSLQRYRKSAVWGEKQERLFWGTLSRLMGLYDHLVQAPHPYSSEDEKIQKLAEVLAEIWFKSPVDRDLLTKLFVNLLEIDEGSLGQLPFELFKDELEGKLQNEAVCLRVLKLFEDDEDKLLARARKLRSKSWQSLQSLNRENQKKYGIEFKTTAEIIDSMTDPNVFCMQVCCEK